MEELVSANSSLRLGAMTQLVRLLLIEARLFLVENYFQTPSPSSASVQPRLSRISGRAYHGVKPYNPSLKVLSPVNVFGLCLKLGSI
jgi:hypothetical protein